MCHHFTTKKVNCCNDNQVTLALALKKVIMHQYQPVLRTIRMKKALWLALATSFILVGCANSNTLGGDVYTVDQAKVKQAVAYGTIIAASPAKIQNKQTGIGGLSGGAIGGVAGAAMGHGHGSTIASVVGAFGGMILGNQIEQQATLKQAVELTVRGDDGKEFVVVQKKDDRFKDGTRVKIVGTGSNVNVTPL